MPIFEYQCSKCQHTYEIFHKSDSNSEKITCPECNSNEYKKLISSFSSISGGSSDFSDNPCASGSCGYNPYSAGCNSGMCGLDN